jgi:hypothetical protein
MYGFGKNGLKFIIIFVVKLLIVIFYSHILKEFWLENKLDVLDIIKSNILFYKNSKYEIISLTFGPLKVV